MWADSDKPVKGRCWLSRELRRGVSGRIIVVPGELWGTVMLLVIRFDINSSAGTFSVYDPTHDTRKQCTFAAMVSKVLAMARVKTELIKSSHRYWEGHQQLPLVLHEEEATITVVAVYTCLKKWPYYNPSATTISEETNSGGVRIAFTRLFMYWQCPRDVFLPNTAVVCSGRSAGACEEHLGMANKVRIPRGQPEEAHDENEDATEDSGSLTGSSEGEDHRAEAADG